MYYQLGGGLEISRPKEKGVEGNGVGLGRGYKKREKNAKTLPSFIQSLLSKLDRVEGIDDLVHLIQI